MTLRIMLLGLVASMGLELPRGGDLSSWTKSGQEWVESRIADLSGSPVGADPVLVEAADRHQADQQRDQPTPSEGPAAKATDDLVFDTIAEGMAADFAADLVAIRDEAPKSAPPEPAPVLAEAVVEPEASPDLMPPPTVSPAEVASVEPAPFTDEVDEAANRSDRIANAVRLTREAAQAWAAVIQESAQAAEPAY